MTQTVVERALVRSRRKMSYQEAQDEGLPPLDEIGPLRLALEQRAQRDPPRRPGAGDRAEPRQPRPATAWRSRSQLPIEGWNEQISLMVGMEAARLMLERGVGLLRVTAPT